MKINIVISSEILKILFLHEMISLYPFMNKKHLFLVFVIFQKHALNSGKEEHNNGDGQYCLGGLCQARMVSDERDSIICPPYAKDSVCRGTR